MKTRTDNYRFSFAKNDVQGEARLAELRKELKGSAYRVCVKGRLGKDNPAADKYKARAKRMWSGAYQTILLADAASFDVYVYVR